mmetsp:Transcript_17427/g.29416  ORF Transcript_17427/g.29416 Transcript_17427/m.29416 type:complete len:263 (-) Transcript_17427:210-998(-)
MFLSLCCTQESGVSVISLSKQTRERECPFANLEFAVHYEGKSRQKCPFHAHKLPQSNNISGTVLLNVQNGKVQVSRAQSALLRDIGGGDRIREFVTRFYARAFEDKHIQPFFFADDGATAHARRLADWIIQKMGEEGNPWSDSGRSGMRQRSHFYAWHSYKRHPSLKGQRFKLDDCRVWMRLHFWAARECGLAVHRALWAWYTAFIGHFIAIYERTAPAYAMESADWSAHPENIELYEKQDKLMCDVVGKQSKPSAFSGINV